jgi:hypothetical protein
MAKAKHSSTVSEVSTLPTAKTRAVSSAAAISTAAISEDERRRMIAEAAYYLAEQRGFTGGDPDGDWLQAEVQINRLLGPQITVTH